MHEQPGQKASEPNNRNRGQVLRVPILQSYWFTGLVAGLLALVLVAGLLAAGLVPVKPNYVAAMRLDLPAAAKRIALPDVAGPDDELLPLVVIDAGHGGHDPGAVSEELLEKELVLDLALALRERLLEDGAIRIAMTRKDDRFLAFAERVAIARELGADLFLSIHADSAGEREDVTGASIYVLSDKATSEAAARFAARENDADMVNGLPVSGRDAEVNDILVELSQRRTSAASEEFVDLILREGEGVIRFHPQPRRAAGLAVLRAPDVPSVLFESGFISNPEEARALASEAGQRSFAEGLAQAVRVYFARNPPERE